LINHSLFTEIALNYGFSELNISRVIKGGNSHVLKIESTHSKPLALKVYEGTKERRLRSLMHELEAYRVLHNNGIINVPRLRNYSEQFPSILCDWIDGDTPKVDRKSKDAIINCILELKSLHKKNQCNLNSVDSISSYDELIMQIEARHEQLVSVENFPRNLLNALESTLQIYSSHIDEGQLNIDTLSFSDFGVHNLLINHENTIFFIDFEFFGQDSSVKLISDLTAHPRGMYSSKEIMGIADLLEINRNFVKKGYLELIALKWAYIAAKRMVDLDSMRFVGRELDSEDPLNYISYLEYLGQNSNDTRFLTFLEFKSVR